MLIPLGALVLRASALSLDEFWRLTTNERALAAFRLTFGASAVAATLNAVFGTLLAWVLTRYEFTGRRLLDALVDFRLPCPQRLPASPWPACSRPTGGWGASWCHLASRAPIRVWAW